MEGFTPPPQLSFEGNINENWKRWKQDLDLYLVATEKDKKPDKVKSSILLTCIGPKGREIYNTFIFEPKENCLVIQEIFKHFDDYCTPRKNITLLRHKFFTQHQQEGQCFDDFVTLLKTLSQDCEFGELRPSLIRDILIIGISSNKLRERMLREPNLTLDHAIDLGKTSEETKKHIKELKKDTQLEEIHKINRSIRTFGGTRPRNSQPSASSTIIHKCLFCSGSHPKGNCPAFHKQCKKCNRKGHFAICCSNFSRVDEISRHAPGPTIFL